MRATTTLARKPGQDHGYLTLSLDANGINTYDQVGHKGGNERAQLLARTLDLLAAMEHRARAGRGGRAGSSTASTCRGSG